MEKPLQLIDPKKWKAGEAIPLPEYITRAIRCADMSKVNIRNWRRLKNGLTDAEKAMRFLEEKCKIPGGNMVGMPVKLLLFQEVIFYLILDIKPRTVLISLARRNGKTFIQASLILLYLVTKLSETNMSLGSFALAREQAGILFKQLHDMIMLSPDIQPYVRVVPSSKRVIGLKTGAEYIAGSAEAKSNLGRSIKYLVLDEAGSIKDLDYISALRTSQGSYDHATFCAISTQSQSDADWFSTMLDSAEREQPADTVAMLFETSEDYAIDDREGWIYSNPGIGIFRSYEDMEAQAASAKMINSTESGFRNYSLNQRVAMEQLAISPSVLRLCNDDIDEDVFRRSTVYAGADLSAKGDLTAIVLCAEDEDGIMHVKPLVFCPTGGIEERSARDKAPYAQWIRSGALIPVGGKTMDFDQIAEAIREELAHFGITVAQLHYDKHMITHFRAACERSSALMEAEWIGVPQYFKDMGVRLASLQGKMIEGKVRLGNHPLMNMAMSNAIAVVGREGICALDKSKATQRIDPLVALVMAAWPLGEGRVAQVFDVSAMVG